LTILIMALVALLLPYVPILLARLRGEKPATGRLVFGEGRED
jgi:putative tricarboxylic transport membrane protein